MRDYDAALAELEAEVQVNDLEYTYGPVKIRGHEFYFRKPEDGEYAVLMGSVTKFSALGEKVGASINLFNDVFKPEDANQLIAWLMDPLDKAFDFVFVAGLLEDMIEEWTGRPTRRSSGSTPRRPKTGSGSKQSTPAST